MIRIWKILRWGVLGGAMLATLWALQPTPSQEHPAVAQSSATCDQLIKEALQLATNACLEIGRNEACLGHPAVSTILTNPDALFERPGDIVSVEDIASLVTRPLDSATGDWGIVMMDVQADLPDTSDDRVRLLMFGGVEIAPVIQAKTAPTEFCQVHNTSGNPLALRSGPGLEYPLVDIFDADTTLPFSGRDTSGDWLNSTAGWVWANDVTPDCPTDDLILISNVADAYLAPMQAFTLQMNADATCAAAPSGLLIQAPEGQTANLLINNVQLRIGSTALIVPNAEGDSWQVANLEGHVIVTVDDSSAIVPPGAQVEVQLNESGQAAGSLPEAAPIDATIQGINAQLPESLPEEVVVPPPYTEPSIQFSADPNPVPEGECTVLKWDVQIPEFQGVYIGDFSGDESTIISSASHGEYTVCPLFSTIYALIPFHTDGQTASLFGQVDITILSARQPTPTSTSTNRPTATPLPSSTPTASQTSSSTATASASATRTLQPTTAIPTNRPTQTASASPTPTVRPTNTAVSTNTSVPTNTTYPSPTFPPTTAAPPTYTPLPSNTALPSITATRTNPPPPSATPTRTSPPTNTVTPSVTPVIPTPTPT